uniref:Putative NADH:ubiquinone/plastoquinone oxidoreductase, chain 6 n=1 Tax=Helianthus annuus TaxID=4232 RepID=A0A251UQM8_HELAN
MLMIHYLKTMMLSVLSSLALVSGLMVVRAKNPVHSVLFPIPVFRNTSSLLLLLGLDFFAMIFLVVHRLVEVIDIMHSQTPPWILPQSISL